MSKGWKWGVLLSLLFITACLTAAGPGFYHFVRARVFITRAQHTKDGALARFWALSAYRSDPQLVAAVKLLGDLDEAAGRPQALSWRMREAQLRPGDTEALMKWAKRALIAGNYDMASHALDLVPQAQRNTAAYHSLAAGVSAQLNRRAEAEIHFDEAIRLDPGNTLYGINRSIYLLQSPDAEKARIARSDLERWQDNPQWGINAVRALADDAIRRRDWAKAGALTAVLRLAPAATVADQLFHLTVVKQSRPNELGAAQVEIQTWLADHPRDISAWMGWMRQNGKGKEAIEWIRSRPAAEGNQLSVRTAIADIRLGDGDWDILAGELNEADWGDFDFARMLLLARVAREQDKGLFPGAWARVWERIKDKPVELMLTGSLVGAWKWGNEIEAVWWRLAKISDRHQEMAWATLSAHYQKTGNTVGLLQVASKKYAAVPDDLVARNNFAFLALLLKQNETQATKLAGEVHAKYPLHPAAASTYALALYRQGLMKDGVQALERLTPSQRDDPGIALYYGVLLAEDSRVAEAKGYLARASKGDLLPEEKELLAKYWKP